MMMRLWFVCMSVCVAGALHAAITLPHMATVKLNANANETVTIPSLSDTTKYTLRFESKYSGWETLETNPRLDLALHHQTWKNPKQYPFMPKVLIEFKDSSGKVFKNGIQKSLPFGKWTPIALTFYPPVGAKSLTVQWFAGTKASPFEMRKISFKQTSDQGAINVNPDVAKSGPYDYSMWERYAKGAQLMRKADGTVAMTVGYGSTGSRFPMKPNAKYVSEVVSTGFGYANNASINFYDKNDKQIGKARGGSSKPFVTPANCVSGRIFCRSLIIDRFAVMEAK